MDEEITLRTPSIAWGVAARPLPGQTVSGDRHLVQPFPNGLLTAALDGLGHGADAATAADIGIAVLEAHASEPIVPLVQRCHEALRTTRGAAMSLASFNTRDDTLSWISVGNVEGILLRTSDGTTALPTHEYVLPRGGVVGYRLPPLRTSTLGVRRGDLLIFVTDGIGEGFAETLPLTAPPQRIADYILETYAKSTDDALALVVRYLGGAS